MAAEALPRALRDDSASEAWRAVCETPEEERKVEALRQSNPPLFLKWCEIRRDIIADVEAEREAKREVDEPSNDTKAKKSISAESRMRFEVGQSLMRGDFAAVQRFLDAQKPKAAGFTTLDIDAIFAPLPPVPYLLEHLDICPGAPTLIAGYGYSGKTVAAQSFALTIAGGGAVWGSFTPSMRGRVVHLDYEQGARLTHSRYQRLAAAMGIGADDLRGQLGVSVLPGIFLDSEGATDALTRVCEGAKLLIVDSLRAAAPSVEENSSEVRRVLDRLTTVSEKTGCVPLVISHSRKPREDDGGGARMAIRGSSAIYDACASVLVFSASKGEPTTVAHEKARTSGITAEDFAITIDDVEIAGDPRGGLAVRVAGLPPKADRIAERQRERMGELGEAVMHFIGGHPGCSGRAIRGASLPGAKSPSVVLDVLAHLEAEGRVHRKLGPRNSESWYLGGAS